MMLCSHWVVCGSSTMKRRTRVTSKSMESPSEVLHVYFFDYDRIELYDEENSLDEDRYDTIGDTSAGKLPVGSTVIGNAKPSNDQINDILFVVYTERDMVDEEGRKTEVTRLISARLATSFERGLYYGKYD